MYYVHTCLNTCVHVCTYLSCNTFLSGTGKSTLFVLLASSACRHVLKHTLNIWVPLVSRHSINDGAITAKVEQQYHTANKRLAVAKRIAGSSKQPDQLVKSTELLKSELEAVEEAQHAAKAYTLMVRLFAKVIDRVSDAVAEREVQKSIRPELVSSIGCQTLGDQYLAIRLLKFVDP